MSIEFSKTFVNQRSSPKNVHHCTICPYFTSSMFLMINHVRSHRTSLLPFNCEDTTVETYCCKDCGFQTYLTVLFKYHIRKHHHIIAENWKHSPDEEFIIQNYICKKCNFETHSLVKQLQHAATCLNENESPQEFSFVDNAKKNVDKWYNCTQCGRTFKCKRSVKTHKIIVHSNDEEGWYHCAECTYKSKGKINLKNLKFKKPINRKSEKSKHRKTEKLRNKI